MVDPQRGITQLRQKVIGVGGKDQDTGALHQLLQAHTGLGHESGVHGADALIQQQDFRLNGCHHAERQAHAHTGGIGAQRHGEIIAEFRKLRNLIHLFLHLLDGLAQKEATDNDVVVARDLWVHAHAQIKDGGHAAAHIGRTTGGLVNARQKAQKGGLAGAVMAHQTYAVALAQVQVNIL